jgi:hypothetical protein
MRMLFSNLFLIPMMLMACSTIPAPDRLAQALLFDVAKSGDDLDARSTAVFKLADQAMLAGGKSRGGSCAPSRCIALGAAQEGGKPVTSWRR